jgi:hypothetical protein
MTTAANDAQGEVSFFFAFAEATETAVVTPGLAGAVPVVVIVPPMPEGV